MRLVLPLQSRVQGHVVQVVVAGRGTAVQQFKQPVAAGVGQLLVDDFADQLREFAEIVGERSHFLVLPATLRWMHSSSE